MGIFAFEKPAFAPPAWTEALARSWLHNGYDHWPVPTEIAETPNTFELSRSGKDSALLAAIVPDPRGPRTICSSTLRAHAEPYRAMVELARGAINRLKSLAAALTVSTFPIPQDIEKKIRECISIFGRAIASERDEQDRLCITVIGDSLALSDVVMAHLAEHRLRIRLQTAPGLETRFGCCLQSPLDDRESEAYRSIFNAVRIDPEWQWIEATESQFDWSRLDRIVEWAVANKLAITMGPIINFSAGTLPKWLYQQPDLPLLAAYMDDFLGTVVARYRRFTNSFQVFASLNSNEEFDLIEDDRLRLAARLLESSMQIGPKLDWSYTIREPFGDYLRNDGNSYSPLVFADTLFRSGHESASVGLNIDSGAPRDALDLLPLIDQFSSIMPRLIIDCGTVCSQHSLALVQTALSCESVEAVFWADWNQGASKLYDAARGEMTTLGTDFQMLRTRWWQPSLIPS